MNLKASNDSIIQQSGDFVKDYQIALILLNWNGNADTLKCLETVRQYRGDLNLLVVLVDNHSDNPIPENALTSIIPDIVYIQNTANDGFAEGNNIGIRRAAEYNPKYTLLLNNDTELIDHSLQKMYDFLEENGDFGILGAVNYYYSNPDEMWSAGVNINLKTSATSQVRGFDTASGKVIEADYVPGSSIMVRQSVLNEIGLLDSRYFAYFEEADFCLRAKGKGYKVGFLPDTKILHKVGQSSGSKLKFYLKSRNSNLFYRQHSTTVWYIFIFFKQLLYNSIKALIYTTKYKSSIYIKIFYFAYKDYFTSNFYIGSIDRLKK